MTKKVKLLIIVILFLIGGLFLTQGVLAWDKSASGYLNEIAGNSEINMNTNVSMPVLIGKIINGVLGFLGILFLIIILYAGFTWMTAGGSEEDVIKARSLIKWSIIGVIVILGAYAISYYVVDQIDKNLYESTAPNAKITNPGNSLPADHVVCEELQGSCNGYDNTTEEECLSVKAIPSGELCCEWHQGLSMGGWCNPRH